MDRETKKKQVKVAIYFRMPLSSVNLAQSFSIDDSMLDDSLGTNGIQMKVKVMYDYVARNPDEISVFANEVK